MRVIVCQGEIMQNKVHLIDNMEFMKDKPDNFYDLAICDPPYGITNKTKRGTQRSAHKYKVRSELWDIKPSKEYFIELFRVSKNQIITGGNYFDLPLNNSWIFWHKKQPIENYSAGELIWTSIDQNIKYLDLTCYGNVGQDKDRFHPTQKPVALYKWLLKNYAKSDQTIFDSHVGSGSIRIACHDMGFDFEGCEIDADYWQAQEDRFNRHIQQHDLFTRNEIQSLIFKEK